MQTLDAEQKRFITQEIQNWRKNRILPEMYCDFLLTLYGREMVEDVPESETKKHWTDSILSMSIRQCLTVFISIAFICIVGIYFTVFPLPMQILTVGSIFLLFGIRAIKVKEGNSVARSLLMGIGLVSFSIGGQWVLAQIQMQESGFYFRIALLAASALLWLVCGMIVRSAWIQWIGLMHVAIAYMLLIMHVMPELNSMLLQWLWIPEALLLIWMAWMVHKRKRGVSAALLLTAISCVLAPEMMQLMRSDINPSWAIQVESVLLVKVLSIMLIGFYFRKQWVKWIRDNKNI
ncbi:hypothetical protein [Paenibacillus sp. 1001270B_150601_E10]|uniref:hypothetical protein n=1 Tax=Paenibacillus sp. 1001270B_150601_E10 TaxID=2787079 RepID=UPI0018A0CC99|nr:hypothetical protein [Paenibacillus sp. 1001270B_150601_E10]